MYAAQDVECHDQQAKGDSEGANGSEHRRT